MHGVTAKDAGGDPLPVRSWVGLQLQQSLVTRYSSSTDLLWRSPAEAPWHLHSTFTPHSLLSGVERSWVLRWGGTRSLAISNTPVTNNLAPCGNCHCPDCRKSLVKDSTWDWELHCVQILNSAAPLEFCQCQPHREGINQKGSEGREMARPLASLGFVVCSLCVPGQGCQPPRGKSAPCASYASTDLVVPERAVIHPFIATPRAKAP